MLLLDFFAFLHQLPSQPRVRWRLVGLSNLSLEFRARIHLETTPRHESDFQPAQTHSPAFEELPQRPHAHLHSLEACSNWIALNVLIPSRLAQQLLQECLRPIFMNSILRTVIFPTSTTPSQGPKISTHFIL